MYYENTRRYTMASTCYNIHLRPAAIFKNFLPLSLIVCVDELSEEIEVKAGDTLHLPNVDPGKSVIVIRVSFSFNLLLTITVFFLDSFLIIWKKNGRAAKRLNSLLKSFKFGLSTVTTALPKCHWTWECTQSTRTVP